MQVVIKEGELGSLAPLGGDENTIRAQQVFKSDSMLWWEMLSHGVVGRRVFLTNKALWRKMRRWQIRSKSLPVANLSWNEQNMQKKLGLVKEDRAKIVKNLKAYQKNWCLSMVFDFSSFCNNIFFLCPGGNPKLAATTLRQKASRGEQAVKVRPFLNPLWWLNVTLNTILVCVLKSCKWTFFNLFLLLFSGRQFLASEPAASDTSDSDSKPITVIDINVIISTIFHHFDISIIRHLSDHCLDLNWSFLAMATHIFTCNLLPTKSSPLLPPISARQFD